MNTTGLFCTHCGQMNDPQAAFCSKCGAPQQGAAAPATGVPASAVPTPAYTVPYFPPAAPRAVGYGGFWIRFVAIIIDTIIVRVAMIPFALLIFGRLMLLGGWFPRDHMGPEEMLPVMAAAGKLFLIQVVGWWLYEALMTSSAKQGTLGKMIFGLKVVDANTGEQISFARATGRCAAKVVSFFTCFIGFIIAGFTAKKQSLHDLMATTVVVKTA